MFLHISHGSTLTKEDLEEIIEVKNQYSYCCDKDYLETFEEAWNLETDQLQHLRLKSGVDVAIPLNILKNIESSYNLFNHEKTLSNPFRPALTENLQEHPLPEGFMANKSPEAKIQLGQKYGKICNEKFEKDIIAVKLALLFPDKVTYIKDKHYKIYVYQAYSTQINPLKSLILTPNSYGLHGSSIFKLNFRYISPVNQGNNYGLFFCTENRYMNDLGQEELIGSFSVDQVLKQF